MPNKATDSGIFLWLTYQALQKMNLEADQIFAGVNLPDELPDKSVRRRNSTQERFWQHAEHVTQNSDIGLHVGINMSFAHGHIIEYLFLSSTNFGEGLKRNIKYQQLLTTAIQLNYAIEGDRCRLSGLQHPVRHYLECAIGLLIKSFQHFTNQNFKPLEIGLPYTQGAEPSTYKTIWGCETKLGQNEGYLIFDKSILSYPSLSAEPQILKLHEQIAEKKIKLIEKYALIDQIEATFEQGLLELGNISLEVLAHHLNYHPRTLRTELQSIGTNFENILKEYRTKTAKKLLAKPYITIDQIVYLLGFSEHSAFSRAFKNWTGETPSAYRNRKNAENLHKFDTTDSQHP